MKKIVKVCLVIVILCLALPFGVQKTARAETVEQQLETQTHTQIDAIDFSELQKLLDQADTGLVNVLDGVTFTGLVKNIVDGKTTFSFGTFFTSCWKAFSKSILKIMPFIAVLLAVVLLASVFTRIKPDLAEGQVGSVVFFATFSIVALLVAHVVVTSHHFPYSTPR